MVKRCFKCGDPKPLTEFYAHPKMKDGHLGKCKTCAKEDVQTNYVKRRAEKHAYERKRSREPARKADQTRHMRRMREKYPDKYRARTAVGNAIRDGRLKKGVCELCGDLNPEAHHDDYDKPLEVKWLCFKCHRESEHGQVVTAF